MGFAPRILVFVLSLLVAPFSSQATDLFHDKIDAVATNFSSLKIPNLEKIQLPQTQTDGSVIFLYIWLPNTHRPTMASFEANIGEYFDIVGSRSAPYDGWCYLKRPERHVLKGGGGQVAAMRIRPWPIGRPLQMPGQDARRGGPAWAYANRQRSEFRSFVHGALRLPNGVPAREAHAIVFLINPRPEI